MIEIDGSHGEAGGQILRTAVGLSAVAQKPIRITNIRKGRPKPGLAAQHLRGIEAVAKLCNAETKGFELGSQDIVFKPNEIKLDHLKVDIGTAGSVTLVLQSLMIPAVHTKKSLEFELIGGTHVSWSPTYDYFLQVFSRVLGKMGIKVESEILKYGFYPKGGGMIKVSVSPGKLKPLDLAERGEFVRVDCWKSIATEDLKRGEVAERQLEGFQKILKTNFAEAGYVDSLSTGSAIHAHAHFENTILGSSALGERGKKAEAVGAECAERLKTQMDSGACLDEWMADQVLPYLALAGKGRVSVAELTSHCLTNIWVIEKFLPVKFDVVKEDSMPVVVEVSGL